jgi:hypothetical protein
VSAAATSGQHSDPGFASEHGRRRRQLCVTHSFYTTQGTALIAKYLFSQVDPASFAEFQESVADHLY